MQQRQPTDLEIVTAQRDMLVAELGKTERAVLNLWDELADIPGLQRSWMRTTEQTDSEVAALVQAIVTT